MTLSFLLLLIFLGRSSSKALSTRSVFLRSSPPFSAANNVSRSRKRNAWKVVASEHEVDASPSSDAILQQPTNAKTPQSALRRGLAVENELKLPFPAEIAYDSFSDLTRQPEWSPWLHSVEYLDEHHKHYHDSSSSSDGPASKWTLKVLGVSYSWISVATYQDRPYQIEWESVSGLKNFGQVQFLPSQNAQTCHMTMTMTFVPPRLVASVFRNSKGLKRFMEVKLIGSSLRMFRDILVESILEEENGSGSSNMTYFPI